MIRIGMRIAAALAVVWVVLGGPRVLLAGGGPENVVVVINSASWASQAVANHFIQLRKIPPCNVCSINWTGGFEPIDGDAFRDKILTPVFDRIERRGVIGQIDYIVYSSDFPYAVSMSKDFAGKVKLPPQYDPGCSINSATYLWHLVYARQPLMMDLHINRYVRTWPEPKLDAPTHGFRSWYGWGLGGELVEAGGQPYMLSTMLAMTSGRGNSVGEAIAYLKRSAAADGTHPKGTVYFSKTADVRSQRRAGEFDGAIKALAELSVGGEVITSPIPTGRDDVLGAMIGTPTYSWGRAKNKILPGAICENFTSYGGVMGEGGGQTPLSECLKYGAAGSSGTVTEPYALAEKFPTPYIHVHYARGCTLAESYYQSVFGPAQLLIVGDPLCRPWADIPQVQVGGVKPGGKVSGKVVLKPQARSPKKVAIDHFELFMDGRHVDSAKPGEDLTWDSTTEGDGYHELRVVAIQAGPIETQGRAILGVLSDNHGQSVTAQAASKTVRLDEPLKVRYKSPGMVAAYAMFQGLRVGEAAGEAGEIKIDPRGLGTGPVTLYVVAMKTKDDLRYRVTSPPIELTVEPPKPLPPLANAPTKLAPGLVLKPENGSPVPIQETKDPTWLALAGVGPSETFSLYGYFDVPTTDLYQFQVWHYGELKLTVDDAVLYSGQNGDHTQHFLPVSLAAGNHRLTITGRAASDVKLRVLFGGPGALSLNGKQFRHARG